MPVSCSPACILWKLARLLGLTGGGLKREIGAQLQFLRVSGRP